MVTLMYWYMHSNLLLVTFLILATLVLLCTQADQTLLLRNVVQHDHIQVLMG